MDKKRKYEEKIPTGDLFDNPMIKLAKQAMTEDQLELYKNIGEEMYGTINFEESEVTNNIPIPMANAIIYIEESIRSGQHISTLEDNEKTLLESSFGPEWYKKYGFKKEDINKIHTIKK